MYKIYLLISESNDKTYVGFTDNIDRRKNEHRNQKVKTTKNFGNFRTILLGEANNAAEARQKEKYWKSGTGRKKLKSYF